MATINPFGTKTNTHVDAPKIQVRDTLKENELLQSGESLYSNDGNVWVTLESQCIFALRDKRVANGKIIRLYPSDVPKGNLSPCKLAMQGDGNLCLYPNNGPALWCSMSNGVAPGPYRFQVQGDGNACIVSDSAGRSIWCTQTGGR